MNRARRTTTPTSIGVIIGTGNGGYCSGEIFAGAAPQASAIYPLGCNEPTGHRKYVAKADRVVS